VLRNICTLEWKERPELDVRSLQDALDEINQCAQIASEENDAGRWEDVHEKVGLLNTALARVGCTLLVTKQQGGLYVVR
jgi:hypothetical protein